MDDRVTRRRHFLRVVGGGAVAMGAGCGAGHAGTTSSSGAGGMTGSGGGASSGGGCNGDNPSGQNSDLCQSDAGSFDVGKPSDYPTVGLFKAQNTASNVMIGRDAGGLYAISSLCTHQCCDMNSVAGAFTTGSGKPVIRCICHGSEFAYDGSVVRGPASDPLPAYALTLGCGGEVFVDTTKVVAGTVRLKA